MTDDRRDPFLDYLEEDDRIRRTRFRANLAMGMGFCAFALVAMIAVAIAGLGVGEAAVNAVEALFAR